MVEHIFNNDDSVHFKEDTHQYFSKSGKELTSVTRIIGKVKVPFDRHGISMRMAKGDPKKQKEILAEWDAKKESSLYRGNFIHDNLEQFLLTGEFDPTLTESIRVLKTLIKGSHRFYPEALVHSIEHGVAGQSDLVVQRQRGQNSFFDFFDYKTNEAKGIQFDGIDRRKDPPKHYNKYLLPPLDHLEDCNFNHYAMQLSTYAFLAQSTWGINIGRLAILFINRDNNMVEIPVPYMKYEARALLEHHMNLKPLPAAKPELDDDDW